MASSIRVNDLSEQSLNRVGKDLSGESLHLCAALESGRGSRFGLRFCLLWCQGAVCLYAARRSCPSLLHFQLDPKRAGIGSCRKKARVSFCPTQANSGCVSLSPCLTLSTPQIPGVDPFLAVPLSCSTQILRVLRWPLESQCSLGGCPLFLPQGVRWLFPSVFYSVLQVDQDSPRFREAALDFLVRGREFWLTGFSAQVEDPRSPSSRWSGSSAWSFRT